MAGKTSSNNSQKTRRNHFGGEKLADNTRLPVKTILAGYSATNANIQNTKRGCLIGGSPFRSVCIQLLSDFCHAFQDGLFPCVIVVDCKLEESPVFPFDNQRFAEAVSTWTNASDVIVWYGDIVDAVSEGL